MDDYSFDFIQLSKKENSQTAFDDGIYYVFNASKPEHIKFKIRTLSPEVESCDIRVASLMTDL